MEASSHTENNYVRILALDAGGVKCISSLLILQALMPRVRNENTGLEEVALPCEYFQLICGSQWGGVLAIMLGRLKMSIDECLTWLLKLHWTDPSFLISLIPFGPFSTDRNLHHFEKLFRELVEKSPIRNEHALFFDSDENSPDCKTTVLAFDIHAPSIPIRFRSYLSKKDLDPHRIEIWRLALAAICNPSILKPVRLNTSPGPTILMDASIAGYSNPSREALDEASRIWSPRSIKYLFNIGTGDRAQTSDSTGLSSNCISFVHLAFIKLLRTVASDPEKVVHELKREALLKGFDYKRFSVDSGLHVVHSSEWTSKSQEKIRAQTTMYLARIEPDLNLWSEKLGRDGPFQRSSRAGSIALQTRRSLPAASNQSSSGRESEIECPNMSYELFDAQNSRSEKKDSATDEWFGYFKKHIVMLFPRNEWPDDTHKVRLAVLDTGVDSTHEFMTDIKGRPKVHEFKDFTSSSAPNCRAIDTCGHGTHVAGVILQLAPYIELYVARVFENSSHRDDGTASAADRVATAIDHAAKEWKVNIISMSFGFKFKKHQKHRGLEQAIHDAYKANVLMFAAASNHGDMDFEPIAYPAQDPYVFCVNSSHAYGRSSLFNPQAADEGNNFSILGQCVPSTWPRAVKVEYMDKVDDDYGVGVWKRSSGTSVATPIAAAIAALVIQYGRLKEDLINRQSNLESFRGIEQIFTAMSVKETSEHFRNIWPWKVLNYQNEKETIFRIVSELEKTSDF